MPVAKSSKMSEGWLKYWPWETMDCAPVLGSTAMMLGMAFGFGSRGVWNVAARIQPSAIEGTIRSSSNSKCRGRDDRRARRVVHSQANIVGFEFLSVFIEVSNRVRVLAALHRAAPS